MGSTRSTMASVTGRRRKIESPRSPRAAGARTSARAARAAARRGRAGGGAWRRRRRVAYGPAMTLAGSPGARWMSDERHRGHDEHDRDRPPAAARTTIDASRRRTAAIMYALGSRVSCAEPITSQTARRSRSRRPGVRKPAQLLAGDLEREVVAELHPPHVLVEDASGCGSISALRFLGSVSRRSSPRSRSFSSWHHQPGQLHCTAGGQRGDPR